MRDARVSMARPIADFFDLFTVSQQLADVAVPNLVDRDSRDIGHLAQTDKIMPRRVGMNRRA